MKLVTLALIAVSTAVATAQNNTIGIPDVHDSPGVNLQLGCPVAFTDVSLESPAQFMLVWQRANENSSLTFQYKNRSNKEIESISIRADLKVKKSVYDLDATPVTLHLTLTGRNTEQTRPLTLRAYGLSRVILEQVSYSDGTAWTADARNACSYEKQSASEQIGKLQ